MGFSRLTVNDLRQKPIPIPTCPPCRLQAALRFAAQSCALRIPTNLPLKETSKTAQSPQNPLKSRWQCLIWKQSSAASVARTLPAPFLFTESPCPPQPAQLQPITSSNCKPRICLRTALTRPCRCGHPTHGFISICRMAARPLALIAARNTSWRQALCSKPTNLLHNPSWPLKNS